LNPKPQQVIQNDKRLRL